MSIFLNPLLAQSLTLAQTKKHLPKASVSLLVEGSQDAFAKGASHKAAAPQFGIFADTVQFPSKEREARLGAETINTKATNTDTQEIIDSPIHIVTMSSDKDLQEKAKEAYVHTYRPGNAQNEQHYYAGFGTGAYGVNVSNIQNFPSYQNNQINGAIELFVGKDNVHTVSFIAPSDTNQEHIYYIPPGNALAFNKEGESLSTINSKDVGKINDIYGGKVKSTKLNKLSFWDKRKGNDANFLITSAGDAKRAMPMSGSYNKTAWPVCIDKKLSKKLKQPIYHSLPSYTIDLAKQLGFKNFFIHTGLQNDRAGVLYGLRPQLLATGRNAVNIGEIQENYGSGTACGLVKMIKAPDASAYEIAADTRQMTSIPVSFNKNKDTIVVAGDSLISNVQFADLLKIHRAKNASITLAMVTVGQDRSIDFGSVLTENPGESGKIQKFFEKSAYEYLNKDFSGKPPTINTAIYIFSPEMYPILEAMYDYNIQLSEENPLSGSQVLDFGGEVLPVMVKLQQIQEELKNNQNKSLESIKQELVKSLTDDNFYNNKGIQEIDGTTVVNFDRLKRKKYLEQKIKENNKEIYAIKRATDLYEEGHRIQDKNGNTKFLYGQRLDEDANKEHSADEVNNSLYHFLTSLPKGTDSNKVFEHYNTWQTILNSKKPLGQWDDLGSISAYARQISNLSKKPEDPNLEECQLDLKRYESIVKDNVIVWPGAEHIYEADKKDFNFKVKTGTAILAPRKLPIEN
ncbi:MAG: sugar phosphate nucleotidyltransferase [Candidatus Caenarcaniphilales bacterium]|nr:sugar phosphate nucleotidyltransferase [Candidatus Caenarcaniphilales bacterium]